MDRFCPVVFAVDSFIQSNKTSHVLFRRTKKVGTTNLHPILQQDPACLNILGIVTVWILYMLGMTYENPPGSRLAKIILLLEKNI